MQRNMSKHITCFIVELFCVEQD